ncbi:MAG: hypothetical protein D6808_06690 [Candidatus Dadabacteria bacterium]|nr:MAG: hypothetical protein D6808_06690 [Candidatus Dadabacteria bacterium]
MKPQLLYSFFICSALYGCYYGPVLDRPERRVISESARRLNPLPVVVDSARAAGERFGKDVLAPTLNPLIFGGEEGSLTKEEIERRRFEENLRKQRKAMEELDRELDDLERSRR